MKDKRCIVLLAFSVVFISCVGYWTREYAGHIIWNILIVNSSGNPVHITRRYQSSGMEKETDYKYTTPGLAHFKYELLFGLPKDSIYLLNAGDTLKGTIHYSWEELKGRDESKPYWIRVPKKVFGNVHITKESSSGHPDTFVVAPDFENKACITTYEFDSTEWDFYGLEPGFLEITDGALSVDTIVQIK